MHIIYKNIQKTMISLDLFSQSQPYLLTPYGLLQTIYHLCISPYINMLYTIESNLLIITLTLSSIYFH